MLASLLLFSCCLQLSPDDTECMLYKANCLVRCQNFREAIEFSDKVLEMGINFSYKANPSKAFAIKGEAHYHLGEFEKSLMHYYRALFRCANSADEEAIR